MTMRSQEEVQAAHDRLVAILLGELPNPFANTPQPMLAAAVDVLCWILRHEHNPHFENNLALIDQFFFERGLILRKRP